MNRKWRTTKKEKPLPSDCVLYREAATICFQPAHPIQNERLEPYAWKYHFGPLFILFLLIILVVVIVRRKVSIWFHAFLKKNKHITVELIGKSIWFPKFIVHHWMITLMTLRVSLWNCLVSWYCREAHVHIHMLSCPSPIIGGSYSPRHRSLERSQQCHYGWQCAQTTLKKKASSLLLIKFQEEWCSPLY